jgi:uncharacterized protein (TIGR02597 family)
MDKKIIYFLMGMVWAAGVAPIHAESVATIPQGLMNFALPGGSTSYLSLPLTSEPSYAGAVASVTAGRMTVGDSPAPWAPSALAGAAPYFVKFLTGAEKGRVMLITANTSDSVTLDTSDNSSQIVDLTTSGFSVQAGDTFEIFPGNTLASVFGSNSTSNPLLLRGAPDLLTADSVSVYSPSLLRWQAYFFNTTSGCWQANGSSANANSTVLYPYGALTITRRIGEASASLVLTGRVAEVPILTKTTGSNAIVYSSTGYPVDMNLSQIQLGSSWITGTNGITADTVSIWTAALGQFGAFYQESDSTWRDSYSNVTDESSYVIPAGSVVSVLQRGSVSGANSFLPSALPYSLD